MRSLIYRLVGSPPPRDAPRAERLAWTRRFYGLNGALLLLLVIVAVFTDQAILWVAIGFAYLWLAVGLATISWQIRRARRD